MLLFHEIKHENFQREWNFLLQEFKNEMRKETEEFDFTDIKYETYETIDDITVKKEEVSKCWYI